MSEPMLYLCDRRACEKCSPECHHTLDIKHARNFQIGMDGKSYVETPHVLAFLKLNCGLRKQDLRNLRRMVDEQVPTGIVVLPSYLPTTHLYDINDHLSKRTKLWILNRFAMTLVATIEFGPF